MVCPVSLPARAGAADNHSVIIEFRVDHVDQAQRCCPEVEDDAIGKPLLAVS
jgi:hypothetical protein